MTRVRATLGPEEAARLHAALAPLPRTWRDRFWDAQPWLGLLALVWLGVLTVVVAWLVWHS